MTADKGKSGIGLRLQALGEGFQRLIWFQISDFLFLISYFAWLLVRISAFTGRPDPQAAVLNPRRRSTKIYTLRD